MRKLLPLLSILVVYFVLAIALAIRVPLNKAPDEAAHWEYVEAIATTHALPVFQGQVPPTPGYEFHQPPLYYLLCVPGWSMSGPGVQNYVCRVVNIFLGGATVVVIWLATLALFPSRRDLAILAAGLAAIWPVHLAVSVAGGNDALAGLICAALFWKMASISGREIQIRDCVEIGLLIGAGIWTKTTTVVVSAAAIGCLWQAGKRAGAARGRFLVTAVLVGIAVALPILLRNQFLYGDPLGVKAFQEAATTGTPGYPFFSQLGLVGSVVEYFRAVFIVTLVNIAGIFGGPDTAATAVHPFAAKGPSLPGIGPQVLLLGTVAAGALATFGLVRISSIWGELPEARRAALLPALRWWGIGVLLVVLAWIQFSYGHFSGAQARYLHPALLPVCVGLAAGWTQLWGRGVVRTVATVVVAGFILATVVTNLVVWQTVV